MAFCAGAGGRAAAAGLADLEDDVAELHRIDQPAERVDGQLELLAEGNRLLADLAGRDLQVLLADGGHDVVGGQSDGGQFLRIEPGPHAVIAFAEIGHVGDAGQAAQFVLDLDRGVIAEEDAVVAMVGRNEVDDHHRAGGHLLDVHPFALDQVGNDRQAERDAVLHQHLGHVRIHAQFERDHQRVGAVVRAERRHVEHVLDAADLLLDRSGHGVANRLGVGAGIDGVTSTVGGVTSGYWATGSDSAATEPASVTTIDSTEAKIGRSMKKCEITALR